MATAKDIRIAPISSRDARALVKKLHYSKKVVNNSSLHLGVFLNGVCEGVMQFGPPMRKDKVLSLVEGTGWSEMLELNRMAFSDALPKNSESRAIGIAMKIIRKHYPHIKWILSFADGTQCGDGAIYRASGFVLTQIKKNRGIIRLPNGEIGALMTYGKGRHALSNGGKAAPPDGYEFLEGFQLRYIYFLDKNCRAKLTCPEIPFSEIRARGAGMYKGERKNATILRPKQNTSD